MQVKHHNSREYFSSGVDIWALGITLIELLLSRRVTSELGSEGHRAELDSYFRGGSQDADSDFAWFWTLARRMLAWESDSRISAQEVDRELEAMFPENGRLVEELELTPTKRQKHK